MPRERTSTLVRITLVDGGDPLVPADYRFDFVGDSNGSGDFDFFGNPNEQDMEWEIDGPNSVSDVKFEKKSDDPFFIGPSGPGCPTEPPDNREFTVTGWSSGKKRLALRVLNKNKDGMTYRYALNFVRKFGGQEVPIQCDPEIKNGDGNEEVPWGPDYGDEFGGGFGDDRPVTINIPIRIRIG